ncbi:MAG: carbon monoxide dehydrogenase, partial [Candidatus Desulforudis sp.]|nr:carbon monoxide dehydrogenase [Desulforudis sp.]
MKAQQQTSCQTSVELIDKTAREGVETIFDRVKTRKVCPYGSGGTCCRACNFGPCRVSDASTAHKTGVCGANVETIVARNFARMVAAGTAAHSDHGREVASTFLAAARGEAPSFELRDVNKLHRMADIFGIETEGKEVNEIGIELGERVMAEFGKQEGELTFASRAPQKRQELWRKLE